MLRGNGLRRPGREKRQNRASQPRQKNNAGEKRCPLGPCSVTRAGIPARRPVCLARAALGPVRNVSPLPAELWQNERHALRSRAQPPQHRAAGRAAAHCGFAGPGPGAARRERRRPGRQLRHPEGRCLSVSWPPQRPPASARGFGEGSPWQQTPPAPSRCSWWSSPGGCWPIGRPAPASRPQREAASVTGAGGRSAGGPRFAWGESGARPVVSSASARRSPGAAGPCGRRRAAAGRAEPRGCGHVSLFSGLVVCCARPCCCGRREITLLTLIGIWGQRLSRHQIALSQCESRGRQFSISRVERVKLWGMRLLNTSDRCLHCSLRVATARPKPGNGLSRVVVKPTLKNQDQSALR